MDTSDEFLIPDGFRYREVFLRGKPQHERFDDFGVKHPKMSCGKRAKIFSPFDALKGFNEAVSAKDVVYVDFIELEQEACEELNRTLALLHDLTINNRVAKENLVEVTVRYFVPCKDPESFSFRTKGEYKTVTGICWGVDPYETQTLTVEKRQIAFSSVLSVKINARGKLL